MTVYRYEARNKKGGLIVGSVEAGSEAQAVEILESHGLAPVRFEEVAEATWLTVVLGWFSRISARDMVVFFRQLSTLVNAQVRVVAALRILTRQVTSKKFKSLISEIATEVEGGKSLSDSLAVYPQLFPELYTSLIRAGEATGTLDSSLEHLANQIEKDYDLRSRIWGALSYPLFIVVVLFIVGALMFIFVLPQMTQVLQESGADLPLPTRVIIAIANFLQHSWWVVLTALIAAGFGLRYFVRTTSGRYFFDSLLVRTPIVGPFLQKIYLYRFAHHLSNLLGGGISIVKALQLIADVVGNWTYRDIFLEAASEIQTGRSLRSILEGYPEIPPLVYQMVDVGEETGDLHGILAKLASFYDREVDTALSAVTKLIEPVIMVVIGLAVGIMVAGILLPIYNLASTF